MWIFIWFILSAILLGSTFWSFQILTQQKRAWRKFATEKKFAFRPGTLMGPAEMEGMIGDYKFLFFTAERDGADIRSRRYLTAVEISLAEGFVDGAVMGGKEMLPFMQSLPNFQPYAVEHASWDKDLQAFARNEGALKAYLTPGRLDAITQILKTKNADTLIIFNDREALIRMETVDPVQSADKLDKIAKRVMSLCDRLRITPEERSAYMAAAGTAPPAETPAPPASV